MRERTIPISISMLPKLAQRLRVLAAEKDKSRSQFVCEVLERALRLAEHTQSMAHTGQRVST